jgi:aspartyl-tRNA synthetase
MLKYGSDKPDLRPGMEISDLGESLTGSPATFLFRDDEGRPHVTRGFVVPGGGQYSDSARKELVEVAGRLSGGRLAWARLKDDGGVHTSAKPVGDEFVRRAFDAAGGRAGDLLLFMAGPEEMVAGSLGVLRLHIAKKENLLDPKTFKFVWVTEFPLLGWNEEEKRWDSMHHPFTSPQPDDVPMLTSTPGQVRARAYDLALNGSEIAGGSIRIHMPQVQRQVFRLLGIGDEDAKARFGFFLDALEYGTPPHGGIAFGLDRILAILCGESSIREVIAFPKTAQAIDLMAGAPSVVDAKQLRELRIKTVS